ncbi:MAG: N-methyl-D-aspartate receptor NMDAR2C subunit [Planctomycetota bacterium]|nr:N-methyl-D-aspartate receptor NMDAR2C subunit [Planctomycetota bacterium]
MARLARFGRQDDNAELAMALWEKWCDLWTRLKCKGDSQEQYARLEVLYSEPNRSYHNLEHIEGCLDLLDEVRVECKNPEQVELAIWFHDAVYDARRADNEAQSALMAESVAVDAGLPPETASRVADLVLATRHDGIPADSDAQLLVDIDLAGLGRTFDQFKQTGALVRREFDWLDDETFYQNQAELFRRLLDRPSIFFTEYFRSRFERQARDNLQKILDNS